METTALWRMRACWGVDAAAAAPPSLGGWVGCSWGGGNRWLAVGWVDRCFEHLLLLVFSRSRCPSLPSLRSCWPPSSKLSDGFVTPLRLRLLSYWSRPPAKFERDSIVGTKKCFCILCAQVRGPGRVAGSSGLSLSLGPSSCGIGTCCALRHLSEHVSDALGKLWFVPSGLR